MNLFSGPDSEYNRLADSTAAMQLINSCTVEQSLKEMALKDISKMQSDNSYQTLVCYKNDEPVTGAFDWFKSDLGGDFWQRIYEQLNGY